MKIKRYKSHGDTWHMLIVSKREALHIISSLTEQMINNSPNVSRLESLLEDHSMFSIAVMDDSGSTS